MFRDDPTTRTDDTGYLLEAFFPYTLLATAVILFGVAAFAPVKNRDVIPAITQAAMLALGGGTAIATPAIRGRRRRPEDTEPPIDGPPSAAFPAENPDA